MAAVSAASSLGAGAGVPEGVVGPAPAADDEGSLVELSAAEPHARLVAIMSTKERLSAVCIGCRFSDDMSRFSQSTVEALDESHVASGLGTRRGGSRSAE